MCSSTLVMDKPDYSKVRIKSERTRDKSQNKSYKSSFIQTTQPGFHSCQYRKSNQETMWRIVLANKIGKPLECFKSTRTCRGEECPLTRVRSICSPTENFVTERYDGEKNALQQGCVASARPQKTSYLSERKIPKMSSLSTWE